MRRSTWEVVWWAVVKNDKDVRTTDPHFVKMVQLLSDIPTQWPTLTGKALCVANRAMRTFVGWRGFGTPGEAPLNTQEYRDAGGGRRSVECMTISSLSPVNCLGNCDCLYIFLTSYWIRQVHSRYVVRIY